MFHNPAAYPFSAALERHWRAILAEYRAVRGLTIDWYERELYGDGWKVFGLYDFPRGRPIAENVTRCPLTAALVREHVPGHGAAGFSVLRPHTRIRPHAGYQGDFLRAHLALDVPPGDAGLRVGGETRRWTPGRVIVFDDRREHAAWNLTGAPRVVLIVDFTPRRPAR
jgi:beta-hydroxylase